MKPKPRNKQKQQPGAKVAAPGSSSGGRRIVRKFFAGTVTFVGGAATLFSVLQLMDVYRDTTPKVELHAYPQSSEQLLPFVIRNPSRWFDMKDMQLRCQVRAELDSFGIVLGGIDRNMDPGAWSTAAQTLEAGGPPLNFPCNVSNHFREFKFNGASVGTKRTVLLVEASYGTSVLGFRIARRFSSPTYLGSMTSQGFQWIEGDLATRRANR
jgi:hypothetical protein